MYDLGDDGESTSFVETIELRTLLSKLKSNGSRSDATRKLEDEINASEKAAKVLPAEPPHRSDLHRTEPHGIARNRTGLNCTALALTRLLAQHGFTVQPLTSSLPPRRLPSLGPRAFTSHLLPLHSLAAPSPIVSPFHTPRPFPPDLAAAPRRTPPSRSFSRC